MLKGPPDELSPIRLIRGLGHAAQIGVYQRCSQPRTYLFPVCQQCTAFFDRLHIPQQHQVGHEGQDNGPRVFVRLTSPSRRKPQPTSSSLATTDLALPLRWVPLMHCDALPSLCRHASHLRVKQTLTARTAARAEEARRTIDDMDEERFDPSSRLYPNKGSLLVICNYPDRTPSISFQVDSTLDRV
ncbi:hypothetical protein B0T10DRAFT_302230 [Thelonectria olida]|uniref:C2H2-type domain-containing protein n=1 Tax=Thelonectria olida TaxID=1576542 RepID=A0A9P8W746_9HYPO|nr:hypothetical protein B0T10DRAFT_302230 [Thelonectria olida]